MDRPFQGMGWFPQIGGTWSGGRRSENADPGAWSSGRRGENADPGRGNTGRRDAADAGRGSSGRRDAGNAGDFGDPVRTARREQRSEAMLTFAVCGLASTGRFFVELSSTVNVSHSGCCLWLRTCPQAGSALALREVPGGASLPTGASQVLFQVAWMRAHAGGWLVGAFALGQADLLAGEASGNVATRVGLAFPSRRP